MCALECTITSVVICGYVMILYNPFLIMLCVIVPYKNKLCANYGPLTPCLVRLSLHYREMENCLRKVFICIPRLTVGCKGGKYYLLSFRQFGLGLDS